MAAFPVQVSVSLSSVVYLKSLFEAGAITYNQDGTVTLDNDVEAALKDIHKMLAHGSSALETALNNALTAAFTETNDLLTGNGLVVYP